MPPFRVRLFAESALQLYEESVELRFRDSRAVVADWTRADDATRSTHHGLRLDVYVTADEILAAIDKAGLVAQIVVEQLSAVHATAIGDPRPWLAFDIDPVSRDRIIAQIIHDVPREVTPRRKLRPAGITALAEAISAHGDEGATWRIGRALHHLRKATLETDVLDRFEDLWNGLELLNPAIKDMFGLETGFPGSPCPSCGAATTVKGGSQGIKHALCELAGHSIEVWKELRTVRQEIAHGSADVARRESRLFDLCDILRTALIAGLCEVLGIPEEQRDSFQRLPLRLSNYAEFMITAVLNDFTSEDLASQERLPYFEIVESTSTVEIGPDGPHSVTENASMSIRLNNFNGQYTAVRVRGQLARDPEDEGATFRISGRISARREPDTPNDTAADGG